MFIIEGFDNCGKTTLIEQLVDAVTAKIEVVKSPGPISYRELFTFADRHLSTMERLRLSEDKGLKDVHLKYSTIHDRFPIFSDQVYGPVLRNLNPFQDLEEGRWLIGRLMWVSPIVVYCRPQTQTILEFKDGRTQMEGVEKHALSLLSKYDDLMLYWERRTGRPLIRYDYTVDSFDTVLEKVRAQGW